MVTERWVLTADYNYLDWSRNSSSYTSMKYENQHKVNLGGSYITKPRLARSTELMGGIGFGNSYINLKGGKMQYLEASVGASFPIRYSYLSLGATWRKQLNTRSNLMQETKVIQGSGSPQITRILHRMIIICWIYICNALHI